jgi:hypothetical protein
MTKPDLIIAELKSESGEMIDVLSINPKQFKTGSKGYYINKKVEIDGKRYQVQVQLVEIGSKKNLGTEDA